MIFTYLADYMVWSRDAFGMRQLLTCLTFGTISHRSFLGEKSIERTRKRERKGFINCGKVETAQPLGLTFHLPLNSFVVDLQQGFSLSEAQFPHLYGG